MSLFLFLPFSYPFSLFISLWNRFSKTFKRIFLYCNFLNPYHFDVNLDVTLSQLKYSLKVEAQNQVVRKLEEKERLLQNNLAAVEKELTLRQQAMEMHKRKAIESAQSAADLKLHLEKYHSQIKEVQQTVAEKTSALEAEAFKTKRMQEETAILKRKVGTIFKNSFASIFYSY